MLVVEEDKDLLRMGLVDKVVEVVGEQRPPVMEHMQLAAAEVATVQLQQVDQEIPVTVVQE
jgi:hypothetical protein